MAKNNKMTNELSSILFSTPSSRAASKKEPVTTKTREQNEDDDKMGADGKLWRPITVWIARDQIDKIHNLSESLGNTIRETMYQLLEYSLSHYEKKNNVDLSKKPSVQKKNVF